MGRAVPDGSGALTIDGRWPFNSGCPHAEWFQGGVFVFDGDAPRMLPGGRPDWRFAANQHIYFSADSFKRYTKTRFGIDQPTFLL
jgi:hypothetical protein